MQPNILLWIVLAGFLIVQQFRARPLNPRLMAGIPLGLAVWGAGPLAHASGIEAVLFFTLNAAAATVLGVWRGTSFRVWTDAGQAWQQGTLLTLALWLVSIVVRLVLIATGHLAGLPTADSMAELPVLLAITLGAQNLVVWMRCTTPVPGFARSL